VNAPPVLFRFLSLTALALSALAQSPEGLAGKDIQPGIRAQTGWALYAELEETTQARSASAQPTAFIGRKWDHVC
jgi:hypothetical protein